MLVGPGCLGETSASALLARVAALPSQAALVVDGHALPGLRDHPRPVLNRGGHALLTPNLAEAQALAGVGEDALGADVAEDLAQHYRAVVAVRGADNWIAAPDGRAWCVPGAGPGLSIPGSGDVLAGLVTGLLARTGDPARRPCTACTSTPRLAVAWQPASVRWATWPGSCPGSSRRCSTRWHRGAASAPSATPRRAPRRTPGPPGVGGAAAARPPSPT